MQRICVFCGSNPGRRPRYARVAAELGKLLAHRRIGLVYGGGKIGLMGVIADAVLEANGEVIGIIPEALAEKEVAHAGLTTLHVVGSMHERKALMADLASGFIALPGGFGTLDELFETLTWAQLGYHSKPCGLLNVDGYYTKMIEFLDHLVAEKFLLPIHRALLIVESAIDPLLERLLHYHYHSPAALQQKWIDKAQL